MFAVILPTEDYESRAQIVLTVAWGLFLVIWLGVGLSQIADRCSEVIYHHESLSRIFLNASVYILIRCCG